MICRSILYQEINQLIKEDWALFTDLIFDCFGPNEKNFLSELINQFFLVKTNEEKAAFSNYFKLRFPKTSELPYNEKMKRFQEIFGERSKNICRDIQVAKIKIGRILEYYKAMNEISD